MPKIVVECKDPHDLESVEQAVEDAIGRCNVTYFKQAQAMLEKGVAETITDASRKIAEDTGEHPEAVRDKILRGERDVEGESPILPRKPKKKVNRKELMRKFKNGEFKTTKDAAEYFGCDVRTINRNLQIVKNPQIPKDQIIHEDVEKAFNDFYAEIQSAKIDGWKTTSKEGAIRLLGLLYDLVNIS